MGTFGVTMKKLYLLLPVLFLIYLGCEDEDQVQKDANSPGPVTLSLSSNVLEWTMNDDDDFSIYSLIGSIKTESPQSGAPNMWDTLLYETQTRLDTSYTLDSSEFYSTYRVIVTNNSELTTFSNYISGWVNLWGEYYFIDDTDSLIIHGGGLTGQIPLEIGNLTNLTILSLVDNPFPTGPIPMEIGNLTNLTHLNLYENNLTGEIPFVIGFLANVELETGMYKLTHLNLSDNQLTGEIPSQMGNLTNLIHLNLSDNQLTGEIPSQIGNLTNLIHLNLYENNLTGEIPSQIGNLNYMARLHLNDNQFTGVKVGYNEITGEISETICNLNINWSDSSIFNISNNQLCPPCPPCIEDYMGDQDTNGCP